MRENAATDLVLLLPGNILAAFKSVLHTIDDDGYLKIYRATGPDGRKKELVAVYNHWVGIHDSSEQFRIQQLCDDVQDAEGD